MNRCPECKSENIEYRSSELMCKNCGLIIEDTLADLSSFREGTSVSTPIGQDGAIVKTNWLLTYDEKSLVNAEMVVSDIGLRLNMPISSQKYALELYRKVFLERLCNIRNNTAMLYACIYASCLINDIPKTAYEITIGSEVTLIDMIRAYNQIRNKLRLKAIYFNPAELLPKYVSSLGLSNKCLRRAIEIMDGIKDTTFYYGKNPRSLIAATIYLAAKDCNEEITQREVGNELGVQCVTVRKRYKEIRKSRSLC